MILEKLGALGFISLGKATALLALVGPAVALRPSVDEAPPASVPPPTQTRFPDRAPEASPAARMAAETQIDRLKAIVTDCDAGAKRALALHANAGSRIAEVEAELEAIRAELAAINKKAG